MVHYAQLAGHDPGSVLDGPQRRLTRNRRTLLSALAAMQGKAQLDDLPHATVGGASKTIRLLHEMRKAGLVHLLESRTPRGRTGATHNVSITRIEITPAGRALLGLEATMPGDDDTAAVAQGGTHDDAPGASPEQGDDVPDDLDPPMGPPPPTGQNGAGPWTVPDDRRFGIGLGYRQGAAVVSAARGGHTSGGPVERVRLPSAAYPVLTALRERQARYQRLQGLLREAAELADDTGLGVQLLQQSEAPPPLTDAEREYLRYAAVHPDDD